MKIALYLNNLWGISATARIAQTLSEEFTKREHEVEFFINKPPVEIETNLPVRILKGKNDISRALELASIFERENFDVCLGFMKPQSVVLGLAKILKGKAFKTKLVGSIHNSDNFLSYPRFYHIPYRFLVKILLEKLDGLVVVSEWVKRDVQEAFFVNEGLLKVIYNPIDTQRVLELSKEPIEGELKEIFKNPVVINVSRLEKQKGLHHLIKIFSRVAERVKNSHLVVVGDGSLRGELESLTDTLGLKDRVHFLGWRENPFKYVARSKVFAMTSLWEGLPMVSLETLSLGVPMVAFKTRGGHVEVLKDCCPLVDYPDEERYAEILVRILTDKDYRGSLVKRATQRVKNFSAERVAEEYLGYFEGLL